MKLPRHKGITRITTVETTRDYRYEFTYADLIRLLRLPEGSEIIVEQYMGEGLDRQVAQVLTLSTGSVSLIGKVTVKS